MTMRTGNVAVIVASSVWLGTFAALTACNTPAPVVSPATDLTALRADAQLDNAVLTAQRAYDAVSPSLTGAVRAQALSLLSKAVAARKAADAAYRLADGSFAQKAQAVADLLAQFHAVIGQ